VDNTNSL